MMGLQLLAKQRLLADAVPKFKWYHVSSTGDLGTTVTFKPRNVEGLEMTVESNKARICVAPTIKKCLYSIIAKDFAESMRYYQDYEFVVYGTNDKPQQAADDSVEDREDTSEHWFLKPTTFHRVGYLDNDDLENNKVKVYPMKA